MKLRTWLIMLAALALAVLGQYPSAQAASHHLQPTKHIVVLPVRHEATLASGYRVTHHTHGVSDGGSCTWSNINPGDLRCFGTNNGVYDPCWPQFTSSGRRVVCPDDPWSHHVTRMTVHGSIATENTKASHLWGVRLVTGRHCVETTGAGDSFHGRPVDFYCSRSVALVGQPDRSHRAWKIREVIYDHNWHIHRGPIRHIDRAYFAASYHASPRKATHTHHHKQHACTRTSSGSCIRGGEFCPQAKYGDNGWDADGRRYVCEGSYEHPHWEKP